VIFLHAGVSEGRQRAIEAYGAKIERVPGNYDASVEAAARTAASNGWFVISDTSCAGYTEAPLQVMAGYTAMIAELLEQIARPPTHVFVQGGVGGLAAAAAAALWLALGEQRPQIVVVEPEAADCLYQSARAGHPVRVEGELNTVMAGLACGEVSLVAWTILERAVSHFVTLPDVAAITVMRGLAHGAFGDAPLVAGESAVAGVAVLTAAGPRPELARTLGLTAESRVLCFGTEGDTDPEIFRRITGLSAAEVRAAAAA
jgi:diaminopropionate ammonia-lyase